MLPSGMHTPWAESDRYNDFGAQYHSQPDGHARSVHPRVLSVYASTLDFRGVPGYPTLCRPYTSAATLDTEPLARSYSGGVHTRLSSNHFQFARARHGSPCVSVGDPQVLRTPRSIRLLGVGDQQQSDQDRCQILPQACAGRHECLQLVSRASSLIPAISSGVQITGGSCPESRQTPLIRSRSVAFAMCLKFQVTKYCIPCTAAIPM